VKAQAIAHTMEGLVKYHGLRDWDLRIPYHDSISVNLQAFTATTEVRFGNFGGDEAYIDGKPVTGRELERILTVINYIRRLAGIEDNFLMSSQNSIPKGAVKGLGFSSAGGAALAAAAYKAAGLDKEYGWNLRLISRIARRLAGSACRSVVGYYSRWYAGNSDEDSYAECFADNRSLEIKVVVVPFQAEYSTEDAHREAEKSPFFKERIRSAQERCDLLEKAVLEGDFQTFGELAEMDSLELHAVTMTGPSKLVLMRPESLRVVNEVQRLRSENVLCYYSMQTGPTVYINTLPEDTDYVRTRIEDLGFTPYVSSIGGPVRTT
jgi:phosphomevalonate decarboxylase